MSAEAVSDAPLAVQLAASQAQVAGQEQVIALLRERLGLAGRAEHRAEPAPRGIACYGGPCDSRATGSV